MLLSSFGTFSKVIRGFLVTILPPSPKLVSLGSKCEYNAGQIFYGYSVDTIMKIFGGIFNVLVRSILNPIFLSFDGLLWVKTFYQT